MSTSTINQEKIEEMIKTEQEFEEKFKNAFKSLEMKEKQALIERMEEGLHDEEKEKILKLEKRIDELEKEIEKQKPIYEMAKSFFAEMKNNEEKQALGIKDSIISLEQYKILHNYILEQYKKYRPDTKLRWKLRYRASRDGFGADDFHTKCGSLTSSTVVIIKTTNGSVFGGFTSATWSKSYYSADTDSFLFSLFNSTNPNRLPLKMPCIEPDRAIYNNPNFGPIFGGDDICLFHIFFLFSIIFRY